MRNLELLKAHKKHLESFTFVLTLFFIFTLIAIYFNPHINIKKILIFITFGILVFIFEFIWYKYIIHKFIEINWSFFEDFRSFIFVSLFIIVSNRYGIFYVLLMLDSYILLKIIYKKSFIKILDELEAKTIQIYKKI